MRRSERLFLCVCLIAFAAAGPVAIVAGAQAATAKTPAAKPAPKAAPAAAATPASNEPFTIEQVLSFAFPETTSMISAPKGDRIAWVANIKGRRNLWGAEGPAWTAHQITHYDNDDGQEITEMSFSSDGALIVYVRGGEKNREGELPDPSSDPAGVDQSVYTVAWTGGTPHKIDVGHTPQISAHSTATSGWVAYEKDNKAWIAAAPAGKPLEIYTRGNNSGLEWSPDGKTVAFVSNRSDHSLIALYDPAKKSISYVSPTVDRDTNPRWSPDGRYIAFIRIPAAGGFPGAAGGGGRGGRGGGRGGRGGGGGTAIWVYDVKADEAHQVYELPGAGGFGGGGGGLAVAHDILNWGADGRIIFASEQDGWQHLYSVPMTGQATADLLTPGQCEFEFMSFSADRKNILFNSNCGDIDRRHLWQVSVSGGQPVAITSGEAIEWFPVATSDDKYIAYFASSAQHPATPYIRAWNAANPSEGKAQALMALPKDFPLEKMVTPTQVIVTAEDETPIHCQLFMPTDLRPGEKRPAIIFMHGGPIREMLLGWHYLYYYSNAYGMNQYLTSHGYIVLSVNYRGGIGYGREFRMAPNRGAQGASEYQDIVAAVNYLRGRDDVDVTHVGLWGGSYGGYLTALGLARNSDLFAAGVDLHGVHDWSQRVANGPGGGATVTQVPNPTSAENSTAYQSSPVAAIGTWKSPVLLIQGDDDRNVAFEQMEEMVTLLRRQRVTFEQIVFPDEVHDFLRWQDWVHAYKAGSNFFDRKLKGPSGGMTSAGEQ
jgi:dipeptidyl aminopeptidase/acylaminoacyl peptidase